MKTKSLPVAALTATLIVLISCSARKNGDEVRKEVESINLIRGDITLCGSGEDQFGTTAFSLSCSDKAKPDFNLGIALLHSFEYTEAEKVFADVIAEDPTCVMAFWGAAMANFHPLWMPPSPSELEKGEKLVRLGRGLTEDKSSRESDYLEAIAMIYDDWRTLDHRTRLMKYAQASERIYKKYPDDDEAAIFYSLALAASADPADKTFTNQREAGEILKAIFEKRPDHPGAAHYIIHAYDYPELASFGLDAARKYASIATASAHAQHMPSHIFTRLGLWDESIASNIKSVDAAKCYAEGSGMKGHWDEELHGLDYLAYAHLQKGDDQKAKELLDYLGTIREVSPVNFKVAYCFAAVPARYALERRDWAMAAELKSPAIDFPWERFPWERANLHFARLLGSVHTNNVSNAEAEMRDIESIQNALNAAGETYKANLVLIQVKASKAWIALAKGDKSTAVQLMTEAADMEEKTAKHPVTPGEVIPARELLGDMYVQTGDYQNAAVAYEADLEKHPNRFNGLYGAALAYEKLGDASKAKQYYEQLLALDPDQNRPGLIAAKRFSAAN